MALCQELAKAINAQYKSVTISFPKTKLKWRLEGCGGL
jgi:hypothetical protein